MFAGRYESNSAFQPAHDMVKVPKYLKSFGILVPTKLVLSQLTGQLSCTLAFKTRTQSESKEMISIR